MIYALGATEKPTASSGNFDYIFVGFMLHLSESQVWGILQGFF